jgi:hypothetical protein
VQSLIFLRRISIYGLSLCLRIGISDFFTLSGRNWLKPMGVWQICLLGIILNAASAIFHLFEAFFDFWIEFILAHWNFDFQLHRIGIGRIGSELAESALGVADLPARDNIGCCVCNL